MTKTNVQPTPSIPQHHDTPNNKTHIIKFRVRHPEGTRHIGKALLVDAVITTGATAAACTQALLAAGAESVFAIADVYKRQV